MPPPLPVEDLSTALSVLIQAEIQRVLPDLVRQQVAEIFSGAKPEVRALIDGTPADDSLSKRQVGQRNRRIRETLLKETGERLSATGVEFESKIF